MNNNNNNLQCSWCLEEKVPTLISYCSKCGDSSNVCHDCLKYGKNKVSNQRLILYCSICKENQLTNLPNKSRVPLLRIQRLSSVVSVLSQPEHQTSNELNDLENPFEELFSLSRTEVWNYNLIKEKIYTSFIWFLIFLVISWMFAPFSYFVIFRMKNSKNYFNKFYITWATGMVCGLPLTILFRHYILSRCFPRV